jgi:hypothetical protein
MLLNTFSHINSLTGSGQGVRVSGPERATLESVVRILKSSSDTVWSVVLPPSLRGSGLRSLRQYSDLVMTDFDPTIIFFWFASKITKTLKKPFCDIKKTFLNCLQYSHRFWGNYFPKEIKGRGMKIVRVKTRRTFLEIHSEVYQCKIFIINLLLWVICKIMLVKTNTKKADRNSRNFKS